MSLKVMLCNQSDRYAIANQFGSISLSHDVAIKQIRSIHQHIPKHCHLLDLGVGNGSFLKSLQSLFPNAQLTGVDISSDMLANARKIGPIKTIECSATDAHTYLPCHSQHLTLAHFINAYIPIQTLFDQADLLTKSCGYFSLITTTYDSFPKAQEALANFIAQDTILSSIVGHYYKAIVKNTTVASNRDELFQAFQQHHFEIIDNYRLHIPIKLNNIEALINFGIDGTWFLNSMTIKMLPKPFLIRKLKTVFEKIFTFPYEDTHIIDIILAKK